MKRFTKQAEARLNEKNIKMKCPQIKLPIHKTIETFTIDGFSVTLHFLPNGYVNIYQIRKAF